MPRTKKTREQSSGQLSTIHPAAAGIDIGATCHVVAVPPDRDARPVRTFRSFSGELHSFDWNDVINSIWGPPGAGNARWSYAFEIHGS
jgi:hypothetical protein